MSGKDPATSIDNFADGKLPNRITEAINKMEINIQEMSDWEESKPLARVKFDTERGLAIDFHIRIKTVHLLLMIGSFAGAGGVIWAIASKLFG